MSLPILWLLHLVTLNCPAFGHPLRSREGPIPTNPDIDNRTLFSIVSGCLATGKLALACRRLGLMLAAVIAPELMVGFAARQFLDARWFSKKYDVSLTHGFFFAMGGFVSADDHHPIVTEAQLRLYPEYLPAIQSIRVEDIEDKSKGDSLSKGLVVLQGVWFTTQCLARVRQHLFLTKLEVATLAFQFVNIFIWLLWLHKPLDVQQPIRLGPADAFVLLAEHPESHSLTYAIGATTVALLMGDYATFNPVVPTSVPWFWSTHGLYRQGPRKGDIRFVSTFIFIQFLVGTAFGSSTVRLGTHTSPPHTKCFFGGSVHWILGRKMALLSEGETFMSSAGETIAYGGFGFYVYARLLLILLSFTTLRALPPSAFVDVNWTKYIPHL
ncbi:hypothetical protein B0H14DRAFT_3862872 [Mycena olivaceomarginata]|nr:hypothetical protein B0H14DRAFT_3862872 [Mycena olivaceomarginata]